MAPGVPTPPAVSSHTPAGALPRTPWPALPPVPQGRMEWVAQDTWVNGIPSRVQRFESSLGVPAVLAHYRAHWSAPVSKRAAPPTRGVPEEGRVRETAWLGWTLLSTWQGPFQLVLQVRPAGLGGGSQGLLSSINVHETKPHWLPAGWPAVPASLWRVQQVIESVDGPWRSFHVTARSERPQGALRQALASMWPGAGWQLRQQVPTSPAADLSTGHLATYTQGDKTLEVVLTRDPARPGTGVVIHWAEPRQAVHP